MHSVEYVVTLGTPTRPMAHQSDRHSSSQNRYEDFSRKVDVPLKNSTNFDNFPVPKSCIITFLHTTMTLQIIC